MSSGSYRVTICECPPAARAVWRKRWPAQKSSASFSNLFSPNEIGLRFIFTNPAENIEGHSSPGSPESASSCVISTFRIAEKLGFRSDFRQWEHLLRNWRLIGASRNPTDPVSQWPEIFVIKGQTLRFEVWCARRNVTMPRFVELAVRSLEEVQAREGYYLAATVARNPRRSLKPIPSGPAIATKTDAFAEAKWALTSSSPRIDSYSLLALAIFRKQWLWLNGRYVAL